MRALRARTIGVLAAGGGLLASTLLPATAADAATGTIAVNKTTAAVTTTITITSKCTEPLNPGATWLESKVGLYFPDAFTDFYGQRSTFVQVLVPTAADGTVVAKIKIPRKGTYTPGSGAMPLPDKTRTVLGTIGVDVVCTSSESAFPWQIISKAAAFKAVLPPIVVVKKPAILGTKKAGSILTATNGTWKPTPTSYSYQWKRGTKPIKNAIKKTYKLTALDKGLLISVVVTAKRTGYKPTKAVSAAVRIAK